MAGGCPLTRAALLERGLEVVEVSITEYVEQIVDSQACCQQQSLAARWIYQNSSSWKVVSRA